MVSLYQKNINDLKGTLCIECKKHEISNYKKRLCRICYNIQYIEKRRKSAGFTKCRCGCGEIMPALTTTLSIAQFKHGHCLRYTPENEKRIRENGNGFIYIKNNEIM